MNNLNALLRYKTIDTCLRNPQINCSIELLVERCSYALTECFGKSTSISERTVREDIKILRSDILEFNAPIVCEKGRYFYEDDNFVLFDKSSYILESLMEFQKYLITYNSEMKINENYLLLLKILSKITETDLPPGIMTTFNEIENNITPEMSKEDYLDKLNHTLVIIKSRSKWYDEMIDLIKSFSNHLD